MLDKLKRQIVKLIAAYEQEKEERVRLQNELAKIRQENETCRKQIIELERQIDNFKLSEAFRTSSENGAVAAEKVESLIKEIDRCIRLIEG